jgi:hypothetical protein
MLLNPYAAPRHAMIPSPTKQKTQKHRNSRTLWTRYNRRRSQPVRAAPANTFRYSATKLPTEPLTFLSTCPKDPAAYLHFGLSSPSIRLLAPDPMTLLLLPLAPAAAIALGGLLRTSSDPKAESESASLPSLNDGGTGSILLRLVLYAAEAETGPRRLESGRFVAKELCERPVEGVTQRFWFWLWFWLEEGVMGTGREDLREVAVSEREKAAEGGRIWKRIGSEAMREPAWLRRPEVGTVEGAVVWRGM